MRGASFRFDHGDEKSTNNIPSNRWWCYQIFAVLNLCLLIFFPAKNRCINWRFLRNILTGYVQSIFENDSTGETKLVNQFQFSCFEFFFGLLTSFSGFQSDVMITKLAFSQNILAVSYNNVIGKHWASSTIDHSPPANVLQFFRSIFGTLRHKIANFKPVKL